MNAENFSTCCRLCLGRHAIMVNCTEVAELCAAVTEVLGFEILKEDTCTKNVCRECVTKVTGISMYRNFVLYNQKCIRQYSALQTKISNIPAIIKLEDDEDDDEVVFIPITPQPTTSSIATTSKSNRLSESSSSLLTLQRRSRVKSTARKSTTKLPFNNPPKKQKLCSKRLKVVCSKIEEKDVENVFLNSQDKETLKLNGKIRVLKRIKKMVSGLPVKTVPPIRLKLLKVNRGSDKRNVGAENYSSNVQEPETSKTDLKNSEDDRSLFAVRGEILSKSPSSSNTNYSKVKYKMPTVQQRFSQRVSDTSRPLFTSTIINGDNPTKRSNKISTQMNAVQPTSDVRANASKTSPKKNANSSGNIKSSGIITVNTVTSPQTLKAGSVVSIPIQSFTLSSKSNNSTSTACSVTSTTTKQSVPVVVFSSPRPKMRNTLSGINTISPTIYDSSPRTHVSTSHSNLTITNPRTISYPSIDPVFYEKSIPKEESIPDAVASSSSACSTNDNDHKVKVLSVNELNKRATDISSDFVPATAYTSNAIDSLKLPIKITMVRVRDEMQIKLANWNNREINVNHLNDSEKSAVRTSLMAEESRKQFSMAIKTCKPDNVSIELLRALRLSDIFLKD